MVEYVCPACAKVTSVDPTFHPKKKKKCPNCGKAMPYEELHRLQEAQRETVRQRRNQNAYLPLLLGFALMMGLIIGAFAKSWTVCLVAATVLVLLAGLVYRWTVNKIGEPPSQRRAVRIDGWDGLGQRSELHAANYRRRSPRLS